MKMNLIKNWKKRIKYVVGIAAAALLISQVISPALGINADGPRFNFLSGDQEMFRGANVTKDESVWKDPISGTAGDTLAGMIYYHNGVLNTTAENTRIKVTMPHQTTDNTAKLSATISADNADTVSDTIVDGVIVGRSGLTVNLDQDATFSLVPGSVKWFPNQKENPGESSPLPGGQTGAEILSANGLNIGGINGCWDFAGFVAFQFKSTPKAQPGNLGIEKTVRNVSKGQSTFVEETSADQNNTVEFKINITNTGGTDLNSATASDLLPSDLTNVDSTLVMTKDGTDTTLNAAPFFSSGVDIGKLEPGTSHQAVIKFQAKAPAQISEAKTVTNTAKAVSGSITVRDGAKVDLVAGVANIQKSKSAFNQTLGVDATSTPARAGDTIEYTLNTKNTGTIAKDVVIQDGIGDVLEESNIVSISDGGTVIDGTPGTNDAKIVKWTEVNIGVGETVTRKFTVKVMNPLPTTPPSGVHFDDKMFNSYGNDVVVVISRPNKEAVLTINKTVRDVTKNELTFAKSDTAFPGDTLEYKIDFSNTGNAPADRLVVTDTLPANVALDATSAAIIGLDGEEHSTSAIITQSGILIDTLPAGNGGYIKFRAVISQNIAAGEHLVNTGFVTDNGKTISSTAETVVLTQVIPASVTTTPLPKTGAAAGGAMSLFGALFAGVNLTYLKQKKLLSKASRIMAS